jgi:hypothetical protein
MEENAFATNIRGVSDLIESDTNKVPSSSNLVEGVTGEKREALDLNMSDEELLKLRDDWEKAYAPYEAKLIPIFKRNLRSYLGRNKDGSLLDDEAITAANLQFEAEETFLAASLSEEPTPVVYSDNTPEGNAISEAVQGMLQFHADQLLLRRRLGVMVRQWSIYHLGVIKVGWKEQEVNGKKFGDVTLDNRKIQDFVFDPTGYVDVYGNFSSWLGERIHVTAEKLIELFPEHKAEIFLQVGGKLGTEVTYTEWWTDEYCFSTFKNIVLDKHKNEYFNYEEPEESDEENILKVIPVKKRNHFAAPQKPYVFLSVFSLQEQPHDITGLIEQNIPNQYLISRRTEQIDSNLSQANNGIAFSENNFNQETAKQAANALTKGVGKVLVPAGGPIGEAIVRIPAPNLPAAFFDELENNKNNLRSSWGVQGIASQPPKADETARGMILNQAHDTSRIGGGIGDAIEQVAKGIFNWLVQLYCVFYDEKHFGAIMGVGKATQYVVLSSQDIDRQLIVSVSPNSMKPKDEISKMNMAQNLFKIGAIGPKILLETLDFPNPDDAAADGLLFRIDPMTYMKMNFPDLMARIAQEAQAQAPQPMGAPAPQGAMPPQQPQPPNPPSTEPASAALSQVQLPK